MTTILIACGAIVMYLAIARTSQLLKLLKGGHYTGRWRALLSLMFFFLGGYLLAAIMVLLEYRDLLILLTGMIFFFGALFVFIVVKTSSSTIQELFATSVSKSYVENIIGSMADTLIVVKLDKNQTVEKVNQATLNLLHFEEKDIVGNSINKILPSESQEQLNIDKILQDGYVSDLELIYLTKDGNEIPVLFSASVMHTIDGNLQGLIFVAQDITIRKQAEELLKQSEIRYRKLSEELTQSNSMKELLLDIITHDLKNPAGVISGMSDIMADEEPENNMVALIKNSSEDLLKVIKNATTLANLAVGEEIAKETLDLEEVISEVIGEFSTSLKNENLEIKKQFGPDLKVEANPIIAEVFKNFISNAIKYAPDGKKIIAEARVDEDSVTVKIKDFGESIKEEAYQRIWVRKMQLENEKEKRKGRGLGLAIVTRIAKAHNGKVWVERNEPTGNIFCISIPR